jgi:hypothetical protein
VTSREFPAIHRIEAFAFHESVVELREENLDISLQYRLPLPFGAFVTMEEMSTCYNGSFGVH